MKEFSLKIIAKCTDVQIIPITNLKTKSPTSGPLPSAGRNYHLKNSPSLPLYLKIEDVLGQILTKTDEYLHPGHSELITAVEADWQPTNQQTDPRIDREVAPFLHHQRILIKRGCWLDANDSLSSEFKNNYGTADDGDRTSVSSCRE